MSRTYKRSNRLESSNEQDKNTTPKSMSRQQQPCSCHADIRAGLPLHDEAAGEKQASSVIIGSRLKAVKLGHLVVHVSAELSKFFLSSLLPSRYILSSSLFLTPRPIDPFLFNSSPSNTAQTPQVLLSNPATHYPRCLITVTAFLSSDTRAYRCWLYSTLLDCSLGHKTAWQPSFE